MSVKMSLSYGLYNSLSSASPSNCQLLELLSHEFMEEIKENDGWRRFILGVQRPDFLEKVEVKIIIFKIYSSHKKTQMQ